MTPFVDALAARVLVCDGAMGTMLYARGVFVLPVVVVVYYLVWKYVVGFLNDLVGIE